MYFNRIIGWYRLDDIITYLYPSKNIAEEIESLVPGKKLYFFPSGREALYTYLLERRKRNGKGRSPVYIAIPSWGCPILAATIFLAGYVPLLIDLSPDSPKLDIDMLRYAASVYDIDSVVLVAENGLIYSRDEIESVQKLGLNVVNDLCLAWQNFSCFDTSQNTHEIFSGGFSKPVSGVGFGLLRTEMIAGGLGRGLVRKASPVDVARIFAHVLLEQFSAHRILSESIKPLVDAQFIPNPASGSINSAAVVLESYRRRLRTRRLWLGIQQEIQKILRGKGFVFNQFVDGIVLNKILIHKELVKRECGQIEYHNQYRYDLLKDERCLTLDSSYENTYTVRKMYISLTLNYKVANNASRFIESLQGDLVG